MADKITTEELAHARREIASHGLTTTTIGRHRLASMLRITLARSGAILNYLRREDSEGRPAFGTAPQSPDAGGGSGDNIVMSDREMVVSALLDTDSLEALIAHFKIDMTKWKVRRFVANKWDAAAKGNDGVLRSKPLYQIKAWFELNEDAIALDAALQGLIETAKKKIAPRLPAIRTKPTQSGNCVEVSIADIHMGKLAWGVETGGADYDIKIARGLYREAVEHLLVDTRHRDPELILMPVGNDLMHADSPTNTTFRGTPLDVDSRQPKVFLETQAAVIDAINMARTIAPVKVVMVRGNHDWQSVWYLGNSLELYYRGDSRVEIDNSLPTRKYFEWGIVGLMFTHGDKGRRKNYPLISAVEAREIFGRTTWNEVHLGHLHDRNLWIEENTGIAVRRLPSLCPPDAWHAESAFIGNIRAAEALVWNRERGLIGTSMFSVLPGRTRAA